MEDPRYYVIRENGPGNHPVVSHGDESGANYEAERLAREHRPHRFLVVRVLHAFQAQEIPIEKMKFSDRPEAEVPF